MKKIDRKKRIFISFGYEILDKSFDPKLFILFDESFMSRSCNIIHAFHIFYLHDPTDNIVHRSLLFRSVLWTVDTSDNNQLMEAISVNFIATFECILLKAVIAWGLAKA